MILVIEADAVLKFLAEVLPAVINRHLQRAREVAHDSNPDFERLRQHGGT